MLFSWARHYTLPMPLSNHEFRGVLVNSPGNLTKCWIRVGGGGRGGSDSQWTNILSGGGIWPGANNSLSRFMFYSSLGCWLNLYFFRRKFKCLLSHKFLPTPLSCCCSPVLSSVPFGNSCLKPVIPQLRSVVLLNWTVVTYGFKIYFRALFDWLS